MKYSNFTATIFAVSVASSLAYSDINSDNSKINQRDQNPNEVTAEQQSANPADVAITRQIRQDLVQNQSLSTYAKNVKIITVDGHVTLKGPVISHHEETVILGYARSVDGVSEVTSNLEVAQKN